MDLWKAAAPAAAFLLAFFLYMAMAVLCLSDDELCPRYPRQVEASGD